MELDALRESYVKIQSQAARFCTALKEQIAELLRQHSVSLGVPLESRVKKWESIAEKFERRSLALNKIEDLSDLVGLRLILLFKRDVAKTSKLLENTFVIIEREDTSIRLDEAQFGYQSLHYVIKLPQEWLAIPSFRGFDDFKAEIQIRTLAQHIWAAASHALQYKQESSVPPPVRRSIHRVSALLETVDLEFERVLQDREHYITELEPERADESLNVDLLKRILDSHLPVENREELEPYSELLGNLAQCGITTSIKLVDLIKDHLTETLKTDAEIVRKVRQGDKRYQTTNKRTQRGVFYTHAGLVRHMLDRQFGKGTWEKG